ncbi:lipase family protein [Corynebacterium tapiri]|uniref:Lipase n=1 Tax=Corynebacterium tapiri TaxID=1448266 RepID=A0A5C4U4Y8_9CORY|nr:lipase family protein [Corynebacterium tapiri]TNL97622.1 hypothetical protein FHE74_05915 [Corynebacterium tapiri]
MHTFRSGIVSRTARTLGPMVVHSMRAFLREEPAGPGASRYVSSPSGRPGDLVHTRPVRAVGLRRRESATQLEYLTETSRGQLLSATGALFHCGQPNAPLIGFAPSTQGVARHCDPSYTSTVGLRQAGADDLIAAYEQPAINWLLDAGADVVVIDYPRDPKSGIQLYCDHQSGALALRDAITAARTLGCRGVLGLWGFSQGGATVAAYLEDVDRDGKYPTAAVVGAPPIRLDDVLDHVDGSLATGVIAYTLAGLMVSSPKIRAEIVGVLTDDGLAELTENLTTCTAGSLLTSGWRRTNRWSTTGQSLGELADLLPATRAEILRRVVGEKPENQPSCPVRLWGSRNDDIVPFNQAAELARKWPTTEFVERTGPRLPGRTGLGHFGPYFYHLAEDASWLLGKLR